MKQEQSSSRTAPTQPIRQRRTSETESTLSFVAKPNRRSSNFVPLSSPDLHISIFQGSFTSMAHAAPFTVQAARRRTHPGALFPSPPANSSISSRTVAHGPRHTANSQQMLSPVADAHIAVTGAPSQFQATNFRFVPHG